MFVGTNLLGFVAIILFVFSANNCSSHPLKQLLRSKRSLVLDFSKSELFGTKWPTTVIPYKFSDSLNNEQERSSIVYALKMIEAQTCITFYEDPTAHKDDCIEFIYKGYGCRATVGKQKRWGNQVYLSSFCMRKPGMVAHEVMHSLGFQHEHQRPDRDLYVQVFLENISEKKQPYFRKDINFSDTLGTEYDLKSIMHYQPWLFSNGRGPSIKTVDPNRQREIGQRENLSAGDVEGINRLYCY